MAISPDPSTSAKLTNWSHEPSLLDLKADFTSAKTAHDLQVTKIKEWNDMLNVKGKHKPKHIKGRSQVQPKLIRRQAEWRYSALTEPFTGNDKLFKVKPTTFEDDEAAKQNELLLNYQFRTKLNRIKFVDNFVRATVDEGTSIIRVGWNRKTIKLKKMVPTYQYLSITDEQQLQMLQQALELKKQDPRTYSEQVAPELQTAVDFYEETGQPSVAIKIGEKEVTYDKVVENEPTAEVLNPANVVIDPSCEDDIDKAMFVIVSFQTCLAELKKNPERYKNLDKINWDDASPLSEPDHETNTPNEFSFRDKSRKKGIAYEYWGFYDIHGNGELVPFVATWVANTLIRMELNPFPDEKLPFVVVPYLPVKRELYGEPDAELLEDNQKILGAVMRGMIDLLGRSANGQQGFAKGMLDPLNKRRYESGQDYEFNPNMPPQQGLIEHKYPELPQSALVMCNLQNQEAEALTGVKSFSGGISGEAYGDVAAGIRGVLDAASKREMAILRRLSHGMSQLGNKFISMNAAFLSEEEVIRVTNSEYVTVRREDLKGNFDLEADISTAEIDNAQAQDLAFMLQTIGNTMDWSFTVMILAEIARLKKMPKLEHQLRTFKPTPDPVQEQLKQLAVEKAKLENEEILSKIRLNDAKAKQASSQADKLDLDYVEQETGTSHARDMEKQQAQAEGNQDLQITKALTTPRKEGEKDPDLETAIGFNELSKGSGGNILNNTSPGVDNIIRRDELAETDPRYSLGSKFFDPSLDPATNPNLNI
jgi:hypothetical protein